MIGNYDLYIERSSILGVCLYFPFYLFLFVFIVFHVLTIVDQDLILFKFNILAFAKELSLKSVAKTIT